MDKDKMSEHPYITDKKYDYLVSILLPTRKRINHLITCLESIRNKTSNLKDIEVVLRIDNDDTETLENMDKIYEFDSSFDLKVIVDDRWNGYADLHLIHNPREIPWVGSDGKNSTHHTFIIIHRLIPETLGYYCLHSSADRQWDMFVYNEPSLKMIEHNIELHHHILPAEHVKDGIVTHPDGINDFKDKIKVDSYNFVNHLKKNNFRG
jgi:glycosyltransferase involved in cell wall biosynthesis